MASRVEAQVVAGDTSAPAGSPDEGTPAPETLTADTGASPIEKIVVSEDTNAPKEDMKPSVENEVPSENTDTTNIDNEAPAVDEKPPSAENDNLHKDTEVPNLVKDDPSEAQKASSTKSDAPSEDRDASSTKNQTLVETGAPVSENNAPTVENEMQAYVEELHKKWRSDEDQYGKELTCRSTSDSGATRKRPYFLVQSPSSLHQVRKLHPTRNDLEEGANPHRATNVTPSARSPQGAQIWYPSRAVETPIRPQRTCEEPSVHSMIDQEVLEYLRSQRQEEWSDIFGQSVASSSRRLAAEMQLPLQVALMTIIAVAEDPVSARVLFSRIHEFHANRTFHSAAPSPMYPGLHPPHMLPQGSLNQVGEPSGPQQPSIADPSEGSRIG